MKLLKRAFTMLVVVAVLSAGIPFLGTGGIKLFTSDNLSAGAEATYYTTDKFKYTVSGKEATVIGYTGTSVYLAIPSELNGYTVTAIAEDAFKSKVLLWSVDIPETVKVIGKNAFSYCLALTTVSLHDGLKQIGEMAFAHCSALTSINIPKSVNDIGTGAFAYCTSMVLFSVSSGNVTYKSVNNALYNLFGNKIVAYPANISTSEFTVPAAVVTIAAYAFSGAQNLTKVIFNENLKTIASYAFTESSILSFDASCGGLETVGSYAFYKCKDLTTASLPSTVKAVNAGAFSGCESLRSAALSNKMTTVSDNTFDGCKSLLKLSLYDSFTSVGKEAFNGCSSLTDIALPSSIVTFAESAFSGCSGLTSITISGNASRLTGEMFVGCTSLKKFTVSAGNNYSALNGALTNKGATKLIVYPAGASATSYTVPESITSIGTCAFYSVARLKQLTVPATVKDFDVDAVAKCSSLTINCPEGSEAEDYFEKHTSGYMTLNVTGNSPSFVVSSVKSKSNATVDVTVSIKNNPGIVAAAFTIDYDAMYVSLKSVKSSELLGNMLFNDSKLFSECDISFVDSTAKSNVTKNGVLVTLTFELLPTFVSGTSKINLIVDEKNTFDVNLENVSFRGTSGSITIGDGVPGDVNGDGDVNIKDATLTHRYVAGWKNVELDLTVADVNADGTVNIKDATLIHRAAAKWKNIVLV